MINNIDQQLIFWYMNGFNDELKGTSSVVPEEYIKSYDLGVSQVIIGDDVRSVDYLSEEEILKLIKK